MSDSTELSDVRGYDSYPVTLGDLMRGERATLGKSLLDVQRDLRIKAAYIAAIENSDPSAFQTPGFIAGYVRSYARYLGLDPETTFAQFCDEADYNGVHPANGAQPKSAGNVRSITPSVHTPARGKLLPRKPNSAIEPFFTPQTAFLPTGDGVLSDLSLSAIGSIMVLAALIVGLGYGAWAVLQDIQRVEFTPLNDPATEIATLPIAAPTNNPDGTGNDTLAGSPDTALAELYRPKELDVPVMTPRDGPIAALDPDKIGALLANNGAVQARKSAALMATTQPRVTEIAPPKVAVVASRPAWVRVSQTDGTVLFEKILDGGESFVLPTGSNGVTLRAGNSGAVYLSLDGHPYGPVGNGTSVAKNIVLGPKAILKKFTEVTDQVAIDALDSPRVITMNDLAPSQ